MQSEILQAINQLRKHSDLLQRVGPEDLTPTLMDEDDLQLALEQLDETNCILDSLLVSFTL
jgi:hypothetical protein